METNKFNGTNYNDWLRNLRIVLDFKNQSYVLDKPLPATLPQGSSPEERLTFEKWREDNRKVRSIILASMSNEIQKYAATKAFFGTKIAEGSSVQSHGVKMLSLVEKLEDLKAGLNNDTGFDLESERQGCQTLEEEEGQGNSRHTASTGGAPPAAPKGKGKGKVGGSQRSKANDICMHCQGKGHWKRECPQLLSNPSMFVVEVNMISNSASWVLDTGCGAHICNNLQVLERSRKLSKDEIVLRLGDGKAVTMEAVVSLSLVSNLIMTAQHKRKVDNHENAQMWHARLGHISKDRIRENEILSQWTPPGTPQLNGVAERKNRTLLDMVRSMMSFTKCPRPSGLRT
ncbi:UNVERIFIED_CONTAM: hypothetical protein Slati_3836200 [Sesamum latifolium]|uniref:CCHC-type domain-containing protein n=1 Tax=Sesamum latifolium TaxID=2727402 RepID=A0AAW2TJU8_9LAMI